MKANDVNNPESFLSAQSMFTRLVTTRIRIATLVLSVCFVTLSWGQQPAPNANNNWSEFTRTNMQRWTPFENVLNVNRIPNLPLAVAPRALVSVPVRME